MSRSRHHPRMGMRPKETRKPLALQHVYDRDRKFISVPVETERHWMAGCRAKVRYDSLRIAEIRKAELAAEHGRSFRVYCCEFCKGYHLATERTPEERERVRVIKRLEQHLRDRGVLR